MNSHQFLYEKSINTFSKDQVASAFELLSIVGFVDCTSSKELCWVWLQGDDPIDSSSFLLLACDENKKRTHLRKIWEQNPGLMGYN